MKRELHRRAAALGFDPVGIAPTHGNLHADYFHDWIRAGKQGGMTWMARDPDRRVTPLKVLPEARSIIVVGYNYYQPEPDRRGRIAKYALGRDYHKVMLRKLKVICRWLKDCGAINRPYVDTGPLLEKPLAALAGIGWQGKNTVLLNREYGQWLFLGCILTSFPFPTDSSTPDRCGSCSRCIDVCPTKAITAPYQLDARRCIAYLTIEHHGPIPLEWRRAIGDHLYGCDDCLDVCPWNKWAKLTAEAAFAPMAMGDLAGQLCLNEPQFLEQFTGSPIRRLGRARWLRNVCVVLGNIGQSSDLPPLRTAALDPDPIIAEHAQWAICMIQSRAGNTLKQGKL